MPQNFNIVAAINNIPSTATGNVTSETQINDSKGNLMILYIPSSSHLVSKGSPGSAGIGLFWGGRVTTGATSTFTPRAYFGASSTIANNTQITNTAGPSLATLKRGWTQYIEFSWDSTSQRLSGFVESFLGETYTARAANANVVTGVDLTAADLTGSSGTTNAFTFTFIFGTGNASNTAIVDYAELQAL